MRFVLLVSSEDRECQKSLVVVESPTKVKRSRSIGFELVVRASWHVSDLPRASWVTREGFKPDYLGSCRPKQSA